MVYCMGPKETTAAIEAIESNIPDGWSVERFALVRCCQSCLTVFLP